MHGDESMRSDLLLLGGLDAANPLGFLTLLGTVSVVNKFEPNVKAHWGPTPNGWRPVISGHGRGREAFVEAVTSTLAGFGSKPFDLDAKLPFQRKAFRAKLIDALKVVGPAERRTADLLAGMGSDAHSDETGAFLDTALRMVRSGDSGGQGFPRYVLAVRSGLGANEIDSVLFSPWRYADDCSSLRWDPLEDQRYALRADDPSKNSNKRAGSRGVKAANALAAEALALLPVQPQSRGVVTTGFAISALRDVAFTWPIWTQPCGVDVIRSLLAHVQLSQAEPDFRVLRALGVAEVLRAERVAPNVYYKNFAPARAV
ncbi:MAG: type I-G CRISPR-associated protein, Cas3-extension family [Pseudomonadota bacterium]